MSPDLLLFGGGGLAFIGGCWFAARDLYARTRGLPLSARIERRGGWHLRRYRVVQIEFDPRTPVLTYTRAGAVALAHRWAREPREPTVGEALRRGVVELDAEARCPHGVGLGCVACRVEADVEAGIPVYVTGFDGQPVPLGTLHGPCGECGLVGTHRGTCSRSAMHDPDHPFHRSSISGEEQRAEDAGWGSY